MKRLFLVCISIFIIAASIPCSFNRVFADEVTSTQQVTTTSENEVTIVGPAKCRAGELVTLQANGTGGACAWVAVPSVNFPGFQRGKDARIRLACRTIHHVRTRLGHEGRRLYLCTRVAKWFCRSRTGAGTQSGTGQHVGGVDDKKSEAPRPDKKPIERVQTRCRNGKCYRVH